MPVDWIRAGPTMLAAFLASSVECIEALTVVLAVGTVRGWRGALLGSATAVVVLLLVGIAFGGALAHIPLEAIKLVVGTLLLLFGMRWLQKAILRSAGAIGRHDETTIYIQQKHAWRGAAGVHGGWDKLAFAVAFKSVILEGVEVIFIVIALAAGGAGLLWPASIGALAALVVVVVLGIAVHRPLSRIPENTLKFVVGVLLSAFGTFWVGEAFHAAWPGGDWAIVGLIVGYLAVAGAAVPMCRRRLVASGHGRVQ